MNNYIAHTPFILVLIDRETDQETRLEFSSRDDRAAYHVPPKFAFKHEDRPDELLNPNVV